MVEIFGKDLFNSEYKKEAQYQLEADVQEYNKSSSNLNNQLEKLQNQRDGLAESLRRTEKVIDNLKNTPARFNDKIEQVKINLKSYQQLLDVAKKESSKIAKGAGAGAAGGVVAGTAVAAFGGPALTALAMSIGTASTGTAIAGLSGAAATNAALAWLGGGALAAGGAGVAGGEAVLSLLGPIGWAVGGATLLTTGIMANGKNKKAAAEMRSNDTKVKASIRATDALFVEVIKQTEMTSSSKDDLSRRVMSAENSWPDDYLEFDEEEALAAGTLVNNALAAEKILNARLGKSGKFDNSVDLQATNFGKNETNADGRTIGKIIAINVGVGDIETAAGEHYYFKVKTAIGEFEVGNRVNFVIDNGDTAKYVQIESSTPDEGTANGSEVETDESGRSIGTITSINVGVADVGTVAGKHYYFKVKNALGDFKVGDQVSFAIDGSDTAKYVQTI